MAKPPEQSRRLAFAVRATRFVGPTLRSISFVLVDVEDRVDSARPTMHKRVRVDELTDVRGQRATVAERDEHGPSDVTSNELCCASAMCLVTRATANDPRDPAV
ncbi:MAG: hypothetical protein Q8Q09_08665 [Deltaproteobacteria bacterium]|nr:hypothetical protein [Deltaproteobacteria bacterium]